MPLLPAVELLLCFLCVAAGVAGDGAAAGVDDAAAASPMAPGESMSNLASIVKDVQALIEEERQVAGYDGAWAAADEGEMCICLCA